MHEADAHEEQRRDAVDGKGGGSDAVAVGCGVRVRGELEGGVGDTREGEGGQHESRPPALPPAVAEDEGDGGGEAGDVEEEEWDGEGVSVVEHCCCCGGAIVDGTASADLDVMVRVGALRVAVHIEQRKRILVVN